MINSYIIWALVFLTSFTGFGQIEVMSYNVRFQNENDGENSWSKRKEFIGDQLKFYEPDVLGVQEAVYDQLEFFKEKLEHYEYVGAGRDDGRLKGEFSAVFYNTTRVEMLESATFWLSETPGQPSKGWDAEYPRVCTYVKLKDLNSGREFWVFNTHFDHMGDKARQESAILILQKIKEINTKELPVILMGDLNLEPDSKSVQLLINELNDSKEESRKVSFGPDGTFNAFKFHEPVTRRIDYIFTTKDDIEVLKYGVLTDSKDLKYPSDHFPVLVELNFR